MTDTYPLEEEFEKEHGYCPACNADLDGGSIWWHFFRESGSVNEASRIAEMYGADRTRGRWGRAIGIYSMERDRTVAWSCPDCKHQWPRMRENG